MGCELGEHVLRELLGMETWISSEGPNPSQLHRSTLAPQTISTFCGALKQGEVVLKDTPMETSAICLIASGHGSFSKKNGTFHCQLASRQTDHGSYVKLSALSHTSFSHLPHHQPQSHWAASANHLGWGFLQPANLDKMERRHAFLETS